MEEIQDINNKGWAYFANGVYTEWEKTLSKISANKEGLGAFTNRSLDVSYAACAYQPLHIWLIVTTENKKYWLIKKGIPPKTWTMLTTALVSASKENKPCTVYTWDNFVVIPANSK